MIILWLDINSSYSHSSLALPSLHSQLSKEQKKKHEWRVVQGTTNNDRNQIISLIIKEKPDVILSTLWLFNHKFVTEVLSVYSCVCEKTKIFLGGPEFLGDNSQFLEQNPNITAVFRGEGEEIFSNFIDSLENDSWRDIRGFCYKGPSGYHDNGECITEDFCSLKFPEESEFFSFDKPFVQLETSRGCFNTCAFCVSGKKQKVVDLDTETIEKRLHVFARNNIKEIRILDRTFNANDKRAAELLNLFSKFEGIFNFHLEVHPALIGPQTKSAIESLPEGLLHVEAGIQSLRDHVLQKCQRKGDSFRSTEGLKYLKSIRKFEIHADLISGLPGYSYKDLYDDLITLMKIECDEIQLELLKLLPGTQLRNLAHDIGIKYSPFPPYEVLETTSISFTELSDSMILSEITDVFYNDSLWRYLITSLLKINHLSLEELKEFLKTSSYKLKGNSLEYKCSVLDKFIKEHYPTLMPLVTELWLINGLSTNKGAGLRAHRWKQCEGAIENPIFDPQKRESHYYHIDFGGQKRTWLEYNKSENQYRPVRILSHNAIKLK